MKIPCIATLEILSLAKPKNDKESSVAGFSLTLIFIYE